MAMFGQYFTYNDGVSSDYGVAIGAFQEADDIPTGLERTVTKGEMNRYRSRPNHMGTVYDDVLVFDVTIIKDICADDYNPLFTRKEYRELVAWLSQPNYPTLFHMVDDEEDVYDEEEWYYGIFSNFEIQSHGGDIIGVTCTFTCDSPFAYSDEISTTITGSTSGTTGGIIVDIDSEYIFPTIVVVAKKSGTISIVNETEDREFSFTLSSLDTITIDCQKMTIIDSSGAVIYLDDVGVDDPSTIQWFRLIDGYNQITVTGSCTATFTYRECRKVGAY